MKEIIHDEFERVYADLPINKSEVISVCKKKVSFVHLNSLLLKKIAFSFYYTSTTMEQNIFDDLPSLSVPATSKLKNKLQKYLDSPALDNVKDAFSWWVMNQLTYLHCSRMVLDYLSIPGMCSVITINSICSIYSDNFLATSVDVEHIFSKGRLVLSHVHNGLSVQSTWALMCLGAWSKMGFMKDKDITEAARLPNIKGSEDELDCDWDNIL